MRRTEETPPEVAGVPGLEPEKAPSETGKVADEKADTPTVTTEEKAAAVKETQAPGAGNGSGVVPKITAPLGVGEP